MSIANQYNLNFHIWIFSNGIKKPSIGVSLVNGESKNHEIASFLEPNGLYFTQVIIDEINSFNYNFPFEGFNIWGANQEESMEIKNPPAMAVFNTGGVPVEVPIADFLQILEEWKIFVASVPLPHWLENR